MGMTARSLHEVATGTVRKVHRTGQPIRRTSYPVGVRESRIWRRFDRREINARMRAAETFDREHKLPGRRNGPIGAIGLEVLREMMRIIDYKDGRLEPSIEWLATTLKRSTDAICKAITRLVDAGFLAKLRRYEQIDDPDPFGPQLRQITNAYGLPLPAAAAEFVRRLMRRPTEQQRTAAENAARHRRASDASDEHQDAARVAAALADPTSSIGAALRGYGLAWDRSNAIPPNGENPALTDYRG